MQSFPFTSNITYDEEGAPIYDRAVDSSILRNVFRVYFTNGVFANPSSSFLVTADSGMQVAVKAGACVINGATAYEEKDRVLVIQAAENMDRIDTVVLRLNDNYEYRNIDLYVVKGEAASVPAPPSLTRNSAVYEIGIANLFVSKNSSTISAERITDTRLDTDRCGYAMPIQKIDTVNLYNQIAADLIFFRSNYEAGFTEWTEEQKQGFNEWFEYMKGQLTEDAAGSLQEQVDKLNSQLDGKSIRLVDALPGSTEPDTIYLVKG